MKNPDYKKTITAKKGLVHLINIISSTAFSAFIVVLIKEFTDKNFSVTDISQVVSNIKDFTIFIIPVVSAGVKMIANIKKNYFLK